MFLVGVKFKRRLLYYQERLTGFEKTFKLSNLQTVLSHQNPSHHLAWLANTLSMIRPVRPEDAARILKIYEPHILLGPASFENAVPTEAEMRDRITHYTEKFPWLVYEVENEVVGYAYASTHRARQAYNWTAECSVYVDEKYHGRGIGRALYTELFELIKNQGVVNVLAGIALPNEASITLHENMGFKVAGTFKDAGFKLGKWWDVGWWQLQLQKPEVPKTLLKP